ncbi:MAG: hypothetical protein M5U26_12790 [Planctomycetota bacterium]|nr:hypothetical protein [Planctomycetota bacterium]
MTSAPGAALASELKPDAEQAVARMAAWWEGEILDRPTLMVTAPRARRAALPEKSHATWRERWLDVEFVVERAWEAARNTYYGGECLPIYHPNLGPDVMAASLGSGLTFAEHTSWSEPFLDDWDGLNMLEFEPDHEYVRAIVAMTRHACELGRGKWLVGITDLHPGGDQCAALRGAQQLCLDLVDDPERVRALMKRLRPTFYRWYETQREILLAAGQKLTTSWLRLFAEGRYYIPSNDFSCMIAPAVFEEFFLDEIREEVAWLDRSIYHLDGPMALRHLDAILSIEELDAVQFVYGAGNGPATRWIPVFQRIQVAGKNLHISAEGGELDALMAALRPEGVMIQIHARTPEEAESLIGKARQWPKP